MLVIVTHKTLALHVPNTQTNYHAFVYGMQLSTLLKESNAFDSFLKNPLVEKSEKTSVLNEICSKNSFQPTTKRFLGTYAASPPPRNKRIA